MKNLEGPIDEGGLPAELTAPTGRASTGRGSPFRAHTMPNQAEAEEILVWGPDEDPVVNRREGRSDFVPRALTALAAGASVVLVAMGLVDYGPRHASETAGGQPTTPAHVVATQFGPNLLPSCLADWPDQRHLACPPLVPKGSGGAEGNCLHSRPSLIRVDLSDRAPNPATTVSGGQ